jgi:uncharacterized membrane protein YedE/YeeE
VQYWPFWISGLALAAVAIAHWVLAGRMMAVSSRFTSIVDRARRGVSSQPEKTEEEAAPSPSMTPHVLFFGALAVGAFVSLTLAGGAPPVATLRSSGFASLFGSGPLAFVALLGGGTLVGFGTRMAGGCTSGHGLGGVSRLQRGSLLATAAFFGAGIVVSFVLGAFL